LRYVASPSDKDFQQFPHSDGSYMQHDCNTAVMPAHPGAPSQTDIIEPVMVGGRRLGSPDSWSRLPSSGRSSATSSYPDSRRA
jgi:hypothetical protein